MRTDDYAQGLLAPDWPSWLVCVAGAITIALIVRTLLRTSGLLDELPTLVAVLLAIGIAAVCGLWLLWRA